MLDATFQLFLIISQFDIDCKSTTAHGHETFQTTSFLLEWYGNYGILVEWIKADPN